LMFGGEGGGKHPKKGRSPSVEVGALQNTGVIVMGKKMESQKVTGPKGAHPERPKLRGPKMVTKCQKMLTLLQGLNGDKPKWVFHRGKPIKKGEMEDGGWGGWGLNVAHRSKGSPGEGGPALKEEQRRSVENMNGGGGPVSRVKQSVDGGGVDATKGKWAKGQRTWVWERHELVTPKWGPKRNRTDQKWKFTGGVVQLVQK